MKRVIRIAALVAMAMVLAICAACGGDKISNDANTVNIKVYKGGYNSTYILELKEKFEELYKAEGYKLNILTPQRAIKGATILQEIYADGKVDMYFGAEVNIDDAVYGDYGQTIIDITDSVYEKAAINFDGSEENVLIKNKLKEGSSFDIKASDDKYYGLPYVEGIGGIVFNKTLLESYELSVPRTSNELFECYRVIMGQARNTGVYPYTYISGANNYPAHMTNLWLAQYGGLDWYNRFWSMENSNTAMTDNGYQVFGEEPVGVMLKSLYEAFDYQAAAFGSMTQDLATAQAQIMRGTAVFMSTGDYFFNEESLTFSKELADISFMNTPVISELGLKLFGTGTQYGFDAEKCDDILSEAVRLADLNKTPEQIAAEINTALNVNISQAEVLRICEARGYTYNRTASHVAYISAKSPKQEICELLLRMAASEDGARLIAQNTLASNPFTGSVFSDSEYVFLSEAAKVNNSVYKQVLNAEAKGFRAEIGLSAIFPKTGVYIQNVIVNEKVSIYDAQGNVVRAKSVYDTAAQAMAGSILTHAQENWSKWVAAVK